VKIACDFIHWASILACQKVTANFRTENLVDIPWQPDVLQLNVTLLHAYKAIQQKSLLLPSIIQSSLGNDVGMVDSDDEMDWNSDRQDSPGMDDDQRGQTSGLGVYPVAQQTADYQVLASLYAIDAYKSH
jgi:hypothetical protein